MRFTGIRQPGEFRIVTRSHVIAWRDDLVARALSGMTIRHRLAALSSLFEHLCESNAVTHNPVKGVKRPPVESYEGKTPALGDHQARALLEAPDTLSLKGKRDRAILATLLYHALRREELCKLTIKDFKHERRGVAHLKVSGKGSKTRYVPLHPAAGGLIADYLEADGRGSDATGALFRPLRKHRDGGSAVAGSEALASVAKINYGGCGLQDRARVLGRAWVRNRCAFVAGDRGDQRARPPGRHRQSSRVARTRKHRDDADLRPSKNAAGGQPDFQGCVLNER